jgi:hypothetical protein
MHQRGLGAFHTIIRLSHTDAAGWEVAWRLYGESIQALIYRLQ